MMQKVNLPNKDLLDPKILDKIHENLHKRKRTLIMKTISKVKFHREISLLVNDLKRRKYFEVTTIRHFFLPSLMKLADVVILEKIPIFDIEGEEPLIGIYYHGNMGVLVPLQCLWPS